MYPTDPRAGIAILENLQRDFAHSEVTQLLVQFDIIGRDYAGALQRLSTVELGNDVWDYHFNKGIALYFLGNREAAMAEFDTARKAIEKRLEEREGDAPLLSTYALSLAGLGRSAEAIEYANRAVEMMPLERDQLVGSEMINNRSLVYTFAGEQEKALADIELLLSIPGFISRTLIDAHPGYDTLRDHPRYKEVITNKLNS